MLWKTSALLLLTEVLSVIAAPSTAAKEPCALVSQEIKKSAAMNRTTPLVSPDLAHKCLQSLPFDSRRAAAFVTEVKKVVQWHSTIDTLKNPPSGYLSPAVDLLGDLDYIHGKALKKQFSSQYEFDSALQRLLAFANDGHLSIQTCSQSIFNFEADTPIASLSSDGLKIPQVYVFSDMYLLANHSELVSPIVSINGEVAETFLKKRARHQPFHDPDARYNRVFDSFSRYGAIAGAWSSDSGLWQGRAEHELKFANGTAKTVRVLAVPNAKFGFNYTDSYSLFKDVCIPQPIDDESEDDEEETTSPTMPAVPFLPKPVVRDHYNLISGYFLDDPEWKDLAVLLVPSFDTSKSKDEPWAFANNATKFIQEAKKAGKKKIIIDLTGNGGGMVVNGMDLFKLFFPDKKVYTAARLRAHEGLDLVGKALRETPPGSVLDKAAVSPSNLVFPNQTHRFQSWKEFYGPHELLGSNVTSLFANFNITKESTFKTPVRGYGEVKQNQTAAPFTPEDILLLTDGYCASTCTVFSELMKNLGGVKSIAFGGRPQQGPMQALGGTKGCQVIQSDVIQAFREGANMAAAQADEEGEPILTHQEHARLNATLPGTLPLNLGGKLSVNFKNAYRDGDNEMPLQFLYEPADCRLFYTSENILHPATTWISAARAFWGNGTCIPGSYSAVNQTEWST